MVNNVSVPSPDPFIVRISSTDSTAMVLTVAQSGPQGPPGATGPAGPAGEVGPAGADSTVPGPQGPAGKDGADGSQGPTGAASTVAGPQGLQGDVGPTGLTGPKGDQGPQGDTGPAGTPGVVQSIVAGDNVTVDSTDPANPIVTGSAGGGGYSPPFITLTPNSTSSFGSGLNNSIAALSCAKSAISHGHLWGGPSPWPSVDVYLAWVENYNAASTGNIAFNVYLGSNLYVTGNYNVQTQLTNALPVAASGVHLAYHEILIATAFSVATGVPIYGGVARYGTNAADTCTDTIGIVGLILKATGS